MNGAERPSIEILGHRVVADSKAAELLRAAVTAEHVGFGRTADALERNAREADGYLGLAEKP